MTSDKQAQIILLITFDIVKLFFKRLIAHYNSFLLIFSQVALHREKLE